MTGQVLFDLDPFGNHDFILGPDTHKAFIEGPVAQTAERKTVGRSVIVALAPRLDVRRLDHRVALRCEHPDSAKGTAVLVNRHDGFPESLVSNPDAGVGFLRFLPPSTDFSGSPVGEQICLWKKEKIQLKILLICPEEWKMLKSA